ncbi:MAG: hypothetical protein V1720_15070 [bacterium]
MIIDEKIFEILKLLVSAFAGAFFAFLFLRFADRAKEKRTKRKENAKALCRIELICNENYNFLNDSVYSIDQILKVFKEARERKQSPYSENRLDMLTNDKKILLDLLNNNFVNDYFSYTIMIEKHNNDVESINHFHEAMKMARLTGQITPENYMDNMARFEDNIKIFKNLVFDSMNMTEEIIAKCRVLLKDEASLFRKIFPKNREGYDNNFYKKYESELSLLKEEMTQINKASKERIEKALSESKE